MKMNLLLVILLVLSMTSLTLAQRGDFPPNPASIYFESWNPYYGNDGGNATLTNVRDETFKYNLLAPEKPYRMIQKSIILKVGDVELRGNGTIFKNCILQGDIGDEGDYPIISFQILNQTKTYNNLTFFEYPEMPEAICIFATEGTGVAQSHLDDSNDEGINYIMIGILLAIAITLIWIVLRNK